MELSEGHKAQISRYFAFMKGKRERLSNDREGEFQDFKNDRLADDGAIFNKVDVEQMLDQYHAHLMGIVRDESQNNANISAVYMSQLFAQADMSGFALEADIMTVEDVNLLSSIQSLEAGGLVPMPRSPAKAANALPTLGGGYSNDPAIMSELGELREQNRVMQDRYQLMQTEVSSLLSERSSLSSELDKVKSNFKRMRETAPDPANQDMQEIERSLNDTKAMLDAKEEECERMRGDLDKRVGDTRQFSDLKGLLKKKSDENKELKRQLIAAGIQPIGSQEEGVELAADSD